MKAIFKYMMMAASILAVTSCKDYLEVTSPSASDDSNVFSDYTLAEYSVFSISETFGHTNSYRGRYLPWYGFNTDIEWYLSNNSAGYELSQYAATTTNGQMNLDNGPYNEMYAGIERANLCIDGLRRYGNVAVDADMQFLLGESLTLRAMLYFDLIKGWGDVPARFEPITSETIYIPKTSRDTIYRHILADLEESFAYLPEPGEGRAAKTDRVNKAFAKGLYARIALAASGYALRPDDGAVGTGNIGSVRLTSCADLSKEVLYPKALKYLEEVINSGKCRLNPDYANLWYKVNNFDLEAGTEILYVIPFGDGRGRWNFTFAVGDAGSTHTSGKSSGGVAGPIPTLWFAYDRNDVRRDVSCVNYQWLKDNTQEPSGCGKWYFGKFRFDWMDYQPYTGGNDDGIKPVVMRYSDILLMAAEIANELNNLSKAKEYFLPVRERAFAGHVEDADSYVSGISSKEDMFDAIFTERAFEFVGEFLRKGDLIRWNMLKTAMDGTKALLTAYSHLQPPFDYISNDIYYQENEDGNSIRIWGFNEGEKGSPGDGWTIVQNYFYTEKDGVKTCKLKDATIEAIYKNDPNTRQFWPLFDNALTNSQGYLKNDYGY